MREYGFGVLRSLLKFCRSSTLTLMYYTNWFQNSNNVPKIPLCGANLVIATGQAIFSNL